MLAGTQLTAMLFGLALAFAGGALHIPDNAQEDDTADITLDALPELPDWAHTPLPDFTGYQDTAEKKAAFFSYLYPRIVLANTRILMLRDKLDYAATLETLDEPETQWLERQADRLRVDAETGSAEQFEMLKRRLDVLPPSLVMAQAANESAWGTSRFAREGNNLFGQWCFSKGCGLVPLARADGASHEVAAFESPYASIRAYITNINRHDTYRAVRNERELAREEGRFPDGNELARGLIGYSERGAAYVKEIQAMIRHNNLGYYDREFRELIGKDTGIPALMQLATGEESRFETSGIARKEG
ncbi:glucosaminidase domain-containing protein [Marinobacter bohaiensis]|uniref:glucosaminidase domain-containing protein n=1 Tax=Marinobacter bohaiensis TaxID=2201898 RepID=UPI000DAF3E06|nr:glucosaminidase domain-containing protein [Marinobacter bohaiensis]